MTASFRSRTSPHDVRPESGTDRWPKGAGLIGAALLILGALDPAVAQTKLKLFGHDVAVRSFVKHVGEEIVNTDILVVDKKTLVKNRQVYILGTGSFGDTGFAVGSHTSGAMCDNTYFVLAFAASAPPRINGRIQSCAVRFAIEKDAIVFETMHNLDGDDHDLRSRWIWTTNGLGAEQHFKIKTGTLGELLKSQSIQQPAELLEHSEIAGQIEELARSSKLSENALFEIIKGPGSVRYEGNAMIGKACQAGDCSLGSLLVAIDMPSRNLFLAFRSGNKPPFVSPQPADWPSGARAELGPWISSPGN